MGSSVSKLRRTNHNSCESCVSDPDELNCINDVDSYNEKQIIISKNRISNKIYDSLHNVLPLCVVNICISFIGFVIHSTIIDDKQSQILYILMHNDHILKNIESPLIKRYYISHFDLLYRCSHINGNFGVRFVELCSYRPHLLIICQTNFDHIFAFYSSEPIVKYSFMGQHTMRYPKKFGLYLIQSRFKTCKCPRRIDILYDTLHSFGDLAFTINGEKDEICKTMVFADVLVYLYNDGRMNSGSKMGINEEGLDIVGNELVGGQTFNATDSKCEFKFKKIEVFGIL